MKTRLFDFLLFALLIPALEVCAQSADYRFAVCVKENGKWGLTDSVGNIMVPCVYDDFLPSAEGLIAAKKGDKWGFITPQGNEVTTFAYDSVRYFSEGLAAVRKEADGKWGFINRDGKVIIPFEYEITGYRYCVNHEAFVEGLVPVQNSDNKWGYLDKTGKVVIPFLYDSASDFEEGVASVQIFKKGKVLEGKLNKNGQLIVPMKQKITLGSFIPAAVQEENLYGLCDGTGRMAIPALYKDIAYGDTPGTYYVENDKKEWFLFRRNINGEYVNTGRVRYSNFYKDVEPIEGKKGGCGIKFKDGNEVVPPVFDRTERYLLGYNDFSYDFGGGDSGFHLGNKLFGMVTQYRCRYEKSGDFGSFDCGKADSEGLHLYPYQTGIDDGHFMISVQQNGKWGFYFLPYGTSNGTSIVPCIYDDKNAFSSLYANVRRPKKPECMYMCVKKNGKWGVVNMKGKEVVPLKYQNVKTICY